MFANFTEETATDTTGVLTLAGITADMIPFSASFADGDLVSYVAEDATNKVAGVGTYNSVANTITRNDTWNYNGTVVDKNPATNIALSGTVTVRCSSSDMSQGSLVNSVMFAAGTNSETVPDNFIQVSDNTSGGAVANAVHYCPAFYSTPFSFNTLTTVVSTASVTDVVQIGICESGSDGLPDKIIEIVTVDTTTVGRKKVTLTQTYRKPAGRYFTFASSKDNTATFWNVSILSHSGGAGAYVYRNGYNGYYRASLAAVDGIITTPLDPVTFAGDPNQNVYVIPELV